MLGGGLIGQIDCVTNKWDSMIKFVEDTVFPAPFDSYCLDVQWQDLSPVNLPALKTQIAFAKEMRCLDLDIMVKIRPYGIDGIIANKTSFTTVLDYLETTAGLKRKWINKITINEPFNEKGTANTVLSEDESITNARALVEAKPQRWEFILSSQYWYNYWKTYHQVFNEYTWDVHCYLRPDKTERFAKDLMCIKDIDSSGGVLCSECNLYYPNNTDSDWAKYFTQKNMYLLAQVVMTMFYKFGKTSIYPLWSNQWGVFSTISDNPIQTLFTKGTKQFKQLVETLPQE
jgi:hypothetical protein